MVLRSKSWIAKFLKFWIHLLPNHLIYLFYRIRFNLSGQLLGMTSIEEQKFYEVTSKKLKTMSGAIVDLGCWMCSTTISLAKGLENKTIQNSEKIYAFDAFIWSSYMDVYLPFVNKRYEVGDSFFMEAKNRIKPYEHYIDINKVDLTSYKWGRGDIKLLLVDVMKNKELTSSIVKFFYPNLIEGSILIHQDFKHSSTPWIHIIQYRFRHHFQFTTEVEKGQTVAFRLVKPISSKKAMDNSKLQNISDEEVAAAFEHSFNIVNDTGKVEIAAAHITYYVRISRLSKAKQLYENYTKHGVIFTEKQQLLLWRKQPKQSL